MRRRIRPFVLTVGLAIATGPLAGRAQQTTPDQAPPEAAAAARTLVERLDLAHYKATIKALTPFGDRRQGTDRNSHAVDWIEAQLRAYGCSDVSRLRYEYQPPPERQPTAPRAPRAPGAAVGGGHARGIESPTGVNTDPAKQPDAQLRALNAQPATPGQREEPYATKIGTLHPNEMFIVGAHMDGHGWGEAADDDGSGTALVLELARVLCANDVSTERSIRFALWNNEETGLDGSRAYVEQRKALQGLEDPAGSGKYPEPSWLGMIQHDMVLFDHGMPRRNGTIAPDQRPEADVNVEFQSRSARALEAQALAWRLAGANERYASDYPVTVGNHMTNTDSTPFADLVASVSVRELERGTQIGNGWNPNWHQPTDRFTTYSDADFRLGLNAAQTTLGALAELAGTTIKK
jgi:hypothetical protein